ncbi:MAG: nuclear transport factor 2 family protein, partial [Acidobacteriota bacterium]|nr:nuclear transport factor 2 family protein [Acidobacteriota bacterium]
MKRIFLMLMVTFTFAGYAFGECSESDKKALEAFDRAWGTAGEKGDRSALLAIYADDYVGLPAMQNKTQTIDDTMKTFERDRANPNMADKLSHDNYMITCTPNSAVITHRNVVTTKNGAGGKEETFWTRSVHSLEKRNGKWQVVGNAGNGLDESAMLAYMEMDWNNAYLKHDMGWFERNYAADYSNVSSNNAKLYNKAEDIADIKTDKTAYESAELSEINIRVDGNTAVVTGVNHVKGRDEKGQPMDFRLRFTDTFVKRDGRWQVWASQG